MDAWELGGDWGIVGMGNAEDAGYKHTSPQREQG